MNPPIVSLTFLLVMAFLPAQTFDELYGYARARAHQPAAALPIVDKAIAKDGRRWEGHFLRGTLLLSLGRNGDARVSAQQAMELAPSDQLAQVTQLLYRCDATSPSELSRDRARAAALIRDGENARTIDKALAARKFAEAYSIDPEQALAGLEAAVTYLQLKSQAEALQLLRRLVTSEVAGVAEQAHSMLDSQKRLVLPSLRRWQGEAMQALQSSDTMRVLRLLSSCDEIWPNDGETLYLHMKLLVRQRKLPQALARLQQAVAAGFDNLDALNADADVALLAQDGAAAAFLMDLFRQEPGAASSVAGEPAPLGAKLTTSIGLVMLPVAAQTFMMGSPPSEVGRDSDEALHQVTISKRFWLAETEVTQRQWQAVMGTQPWQGQSSTIIGDEVAATHVSWQDATDFCSRLTERERAAGRLPAFHSYRLPTEAQWEWSARAGSGASYCFGDDVGQLGDYAVYEGRRNGEHAHAVKSRRANALGFFDMHGNVWEWCDDAYGTYVEGLVDPVQEKGLTRVVRGGGWRFSAHYCRSAFRFGYGPGYRVSFLGFRPALVPIFGK